MPQRGKVTCPRAHSQHEAEQEFEPRPSDSKGPILSRWAVTTFGYFPESSELLSHPGPGQMGAGWLLQGSRVVSLGSVLNLGLGAHPGSLWPSQPPPNIPKSLLSFQLLPPALRPKGHLAQKTAIRITYMGSSNAPCLPQVSQGHRTRQAGLPVPAPQLQGRESPDRAYSPSLFPSLSP